MSTANELVMRRSAGWADLPVPLRRAIQLILVLGGWQAYVVLSGIDPLIFPSPVQVTQAWFNGMADGTLLSATRRTVELLAISVLIGIFLGIIFTVLSRISTFADDAVQLATSMLNPLPSVAMLPVALIWFGLNVNALIFVVVNAVVWPVTLNISTGFRTASQTLVNMGRVLGLGPVRMVTDVLFPAALPYTITGLKVGLGYGWRTIIAAELVFGISGSKGGLGTYLNDARYFLQTDNVFAGIITVAIIGIILETLINAFERATIVKWGMKQATATASD
jgi:NitT/TauT family transport system permease protein